jgi:hypothetical protein
MDFPPSSCVLMIPILTPFPCKHGDQGTEVKDSFFAAQVDTMMISLQFRVSSQSASLCLCNSLLPRKQFSLVFFVAVKVTGIVTSSKNLGLDCGSLR